jgi:hypothetical protein
MVADAPSALIVTAGRQRAVAMVSERMGEPGR